MAAPCGSGCSSGCAAPSCGAEIASCDPCGTPSCGVETACCPAPRKPLLSALKGLKGKLCGLKSKLSCASACAPSCGAEIAACDPCAAPTCGAEMAPCGSGCGAAPSCGAEIAACDPCAAPSCDSGCGKKKGLLAKIFSCKKSSCCDAAVACDSCAAPAGCSSCGGTAVSAPVASPAIAPAPVVDPHAYLNTKRHVIQASSTRIR